MPRKRFANEPIVFALRQAENGATADQVYLKDAFAVPEAWAEKLSFNIYR